jgi:hypothetical protein
MTGQVSSYKILKFRYYYKGEKIMPRRRKRTGELVNLFREIIELKSSF